VRQVGYLQEVSNVLCSEPRPAQTLAKRSIPQIQSLYSRGKTAKG